jgi:vacuolar protein sorting-associated protein 13A/C
VVLNKTGLNINIKSKSLLQQAKNAAGQGVLTDSSDAENRKALPYMFSFPSDERQNRVILKVGDSSWSKPQSLDAIGSNTDVVLPSATKQTEIHIGITVQEGEGKV